MSKNQESRFIRFAYYAAPFLFVIYILSFGPVMALVLDPYGEVNNPEHLSYVHSFYAPLIWCMQRNDLIREFFRDYIILCNGPDTII